MSTSMAQELRVHEDLKKDIPPEIGKLTNLEKLHLQDMPTRSLPAEIGKLTNLKVLNIKGTGLYELPPELFTLERLFTEGSFFYDSWIGTPHSDSVS